MVAAPPHNGMRELFEGLVPADVIDAYERLLATDGCAADEAATVVGPTLAEALTSQGMAHILPHSSSKPAWLRPADPDLALQGVLARHQHQAARQAELLLDGQRRLADAQAQYGTPLNSRFPEHLVAVISDHADISGLSAALANTARQDWMVLENLATEMPLTTEVATLPPPAARAMVRCRSIYPAAAMEDPATRRFIETCIQAGEQARLLPNVPIKMKLADHTTAMLALTPAGTAGALIIRAPVIIATLRDYFELLWERATPLSGPARPSDGERLTDAQQVVLDLMAQGLADGAIARRLGVSVVTVRRHITAITTKLSVSNRFAAGAAAQRRGWIG